MEMCACARSVLGLSDVLKKLEPLVEDALSLVNLYGDVCLCKVCARFVVRTQES